MTALSVWIQLGEPVPSSSLRLGGQRTSLGWWDLCCSASKTSGLWYGIWGRKVTLEKLHVKTSATAISMRTKGWLARSRGPRRRKQRCSRKQH